MDAGKELRRIRKEKGLSIQILADLAGISYVNLSSIERGKQNPRPETIKKLADALSCDYNQLYDLFKNKQN